MSSDESLIVIKPPKKALFLGGLLLQHGQCPYYDDKRATQTAFTLPRHFNPNEYQKAMDLGMRRSGTMTYRPLCEGCRKCLAVRVRVADFAPSKSQRRVLKKGAGVFSFLSGRPTFGEEKLALYERYVQHQHGRGGDHLQDEGGYRHFLVDSNVETLELTWYDNADRLAAVGILDLTSQALSSVYFFWEPELKEFSLGVLSILKEIELCKLLQVPYYYLGYLVPEVSAMAYKGSFAGTEVWDGQTWRPLPSRDMKDPRVEALFIEAELGAAREDAVNFDLQDVIEINPSLSDP